MPKEPRHFASRRCFREFFFGCTRCQDLRHHVVFGGIEYDNDVVSRESCPDRLWLNRPGSGTSPYWASVKFRSSWFPPVHDYGVYSLRSPVSANQFRTRLCTRRCLGGVGPVFGLPFVRYRRCIARLSVVIIPNAAEGAGHELRWTIQSAGTPNSNP